ncbi:LysM peptidoglycan-binding domain-containing protein [Lentilactobacillus kisonensis]|uniref:LysM domain protein n=2 Tax=Lentilactobacillus kisonensis TaxID=481722 RepID=H1LE08_9LACO|nr:LysM domain-containing protein [Lentilactobacillus kisonensis]EHO52798.1 LysM domain protein [Lentilactobacillus kisonensis F0435]KRL22526.1 LysM domain protein [Lentilactobacillus kisonensis DSM 19906 = JCM 15041]
MILATSAAAIGLFFAGSAYASASTIVTVKSGDTVWGISQQYNTSVNAIENANNLSNANVITVGQQLTIPGANDSAAATTSTTQSNNQAATTTQAQTTYSQPQTSTTQASSNNTTSNYSSAASNGGSAKAWIANKESGGSYSARNGQYVGKYQLSASYLHGDYSAANQEKVANQYVASRYGSWSAAQSFWQANGWY